jgi:hypothetical protein
MNSTDNDVHTGKLNLYLRHYSNNLIFHKKSFKKAEIFK